MATYGQRKKLADRWFSMAHVANAFAQITDSEFETVKFDIYSILLSTITWSVFCNWICKMHTILCNNVILFSLAADF